jgi:hypothetical protein
MKLIKNDGNAALVEYVEDGELKRKIIPRSAVDENGQIDRFELEVGIPYGIAWADYIQLDATPKDIERELHKAGIWTADDLRIKQQAAVGAIQTALGIHLGLLNIIVKEN